MRKNDYINTKQQTTKKEKENTQWISDDMKEEIKKYLEANDNENISIMGETGANYTE